MHSGALKTALAVNISVSLFISLPGSASKVSLHSDFKTVSSDHQSGSDHYFNGVDDPTTPASCRSAFSHGENRHGQDESWQERLATYHTTVQEE